MILILLLWLLPSAFAEGKPGAHDLEEIKSGIEYPRENEYLDEYVYAVVEAPHGHSVFGYGSADRLGSRYSVKNGERVKILAERKGVSCVIVLSQKKGRWINSDYLVPEDVEEVPEEAPEEIWVRLYDAYYSSGELTRETETTYNANGQVTENRIHEISKDGTESWQVSTTFFDEEGRITGSEKVDQETGEVLEYSVWQFSEKGQVHQIQFFDAKGILKQEQVTTYDDDGSTMEYIVYDDNGEAFSRFVYYRDQDGNEYKYESFDEFGERSFIRETTYNADGKKTGGYEEISGTRNSLSFIYSEDGMLQESISVQKEGYSPGMETRTLYSYDMHGNQTEERMLIDGKETNRHISSWWPLNTGK